MRIPKSTLFNLGLLLTLLTSIFLVGITTSEFPDDCDPDEYSPWADLDDDGDIDIYDVVMLSSRYGSSGCATKSLNITDWPAWWPPSEMNITNWPTEYNVNLINGQNGNDTQRIMIFSTEAQYTSYTGGAERYVGGARLYTDSIFLFEYIPKRTPFNISKAYLSLTLSNHVGEVLANTEFTVHINGETETFYTVISTHPDFLTQFSLPLNINMTNSIHEGINTVKILSGGVGDTTGWKHTFTYEIEILITYTY